MLGVSRLQAGSGIVSLPEAGTTPTTWQPSSTNQLREHLRLNRSILTAASENQDAAVGTRIKGVNRRPRRWLQTHHRRSDHRCS